ncbi:inhibitor of growth protein 4 isoform X2 [Ischnura elegans]|uniref:inhibitor of growth protein 4 isoform X2 n=1 Tax=Ischnura elegans TaxID=197161 RepID=UPI001ED88363|nr:inhibitor of growth protein 4 isoform X2 [Ischnura elegans]
MTTALYLEHYLDSLEHLPIELQRNFTLMRDLDARAQGLMKNIDKLADDFLRNVKNMGPDKKKDQMDSIQKLFNKAKEYGDDKVQLAIQTYELVDKHIRRLDSDLARFESEIQDKSNSRAQEDATSSKRRKKLKEEKKKKRGASAVAAGGAASSEDDVRSLKLARKRPKKGGVGEETKGAGGGSSKGGGGGEEKGEGGVEGAGGDGSGSKGGSKGSGSKAAAPSAITHPSDVLDMPVDPNEPTYCLCHQVSYGEMIGCDNLDCPIEWFHFACVGLTTKPKGKWYCPKCMADRKKK